MSSIDSLESSMIALFGAVGIALVFGLKRCYYRVKNNRHTTDEPLPPYSPPEIPHSNNTYPLQLPPPPPYSQNPPPFSI